MADKTLTRKAKAGIKDVQRQALKPVTAAQASLIQMQQVQIRLQYQQMLAAGGPMPSFRDVGFQVFSDSDEDGILLYLLTLLGSGERRLVDIGSAGLGASNTANLIINHGWGGTLFEGDTASVEKTLAEYAARGPLLLPNVVGAWVTAENINELVSKHCPTGVVDLLSIDIDGNDYWIWKALDVVSPRIVVIEYQDILGPERSVVIPYDPEFSLSNYPENESNNNYVGASLRAMVKLGKSKGYRFVASNVFGFNAFFVREDIAPPLDVLPEIPVEAGLTHPWNEYGLRERWPLVAHLPWVEV